MPEEDITVIARNLPWNQLQVNSISWCPYSSTAANDCKRLTLGSQNEASLQDSRSSQERKGIIEWEWGRDLLCYWFCQEVKTFGLATSSKQGPLPYYIQLTSLCKYPDKVIALSSQIAIKAVVQNNSRKLEDYMLLVQILHLHKHFSIQICLVQSECSCAVQCGGCDGGRKVLSVCSHVLCAIYERITKSWYWNQSWGQSCFWADWYQHDWWHQTRACKLDSMDFKVCISNISKVVYYIECFRYTVAWRKYVPECWDTICCEFRSTRCLGLFYMYQFLCPLNFAYREAVLIQHLIGSGQEGCRN